MNDLSDLTPAELELYEERAAIREFDGGLPRHEAEMRAFEDTLAHRRDRHPRSHRERVYGRERQS